MTQLAQSSTTNGQQAATEAEARLTTASSDGLQFMFGAQKLIASEITFAADQMMERAKTETHLLSEFISKLAGSHSVKDLATMYGECAQHQLDFIRRDCERLVKHSERVVAATSKLFSSQAQA
jgi:hypothetical protein